MNLFGFQPVEFIKILMVLFFAGYFAQRWEFLRVLKERRPELARTRGMWRFPGSNICCHCLPQSPCSFCSSFCRKTLALRW